MSPDDKMDNTHPLLDQAIVALGTWCQAIVIKYFLFAQLFRSFSDWSTMFLSDSFLPRLVSNSIIAQLVLIGLLQKCSAISFTFWPAKVPTR